MTFISYCMFYTLHVVEPLRYDSVLIKETNEFRPLTSNTVDQILAYHFPTSGYC